MSILKNKIEFPFLEFSQKSFQDPNFEAIFPQKIKLPERQFPPKFTVEKENSFCGGYFVCYERNFTPEEIMDHCQNGHWQYLANLAGDFLIIYVDFSKRELYVLTDQTGKFSCYFSLQGGKLILSTDFGVIKNSLNSCTLNLSAAFDSLSGTSWLLSSEETVLLEVNQIPPGVLLKVNSDFSHSLISLVDIDSFFGQRVYPYTSFEEFANDYVLLLGKLVEERLKVLGDCSFGAELSSGFDSSLVCYLLRQFSKNPFHCHTLVSRFTLKDTDPGIVREFAQKHNLEVSFLKADDLYPFSEFDLNWTKEKFYPGAHAVEMMFIQGNKIAETGGVALFNGIGGDESYVSPIFEDFCRFPVQFSYFYGPVNSLKFYGLSGFLTKKGKEFLLNKERFSRKKYFPAVLASSAVLGTSFHHSVYWETGIWPMTPFIDPRLIQFARNLPIHKPDGPLKQKMWTHRKDIFVKSQFREKWHLGELMNRFVIERPNFVISVLENSILASSGLVRADRIVEDFRQGRYKFYQGDAANIYLHNLLRLEYFIQQNNIKVPDY